MISFRGWQSVDFCFFKMFLSCLFKRLLIKTGNEINGMRGMRGPGLRGPGLGSPWVERAGRFIVLCSWSERFNPTVPLSTQKY